MATIWEGKNESASELYASLDSESPLSEEILLSLAHSYSLSSSLLSLTALDAGNPPE